MLVYVMAEIAIIATDLAEVVGTAIALNILFNLPLVVGVLITIIDVLVVLMAYRPNGPLLFVRIFEMFVSVLVTATVICFGIELYQVSHDKSIDFDLGDVFKGFLPNEKVIDLSDREGGNGLFLSLAILGATVMPHSLYLGSGLVQSRLKDYDNRNGYTIPSSEGEVSDVHEIEGEGDEFPEDSIQDIRQKYAQEEEDHYRPSIHAINDTMSYTIVELVISLFTVALFVNSAILIVAGATLKKKDDKRDDEHEHDGNESDDEDEHYENADLFTIYKLLSTHLSKTAGVVFALALLFSGQSAGIVCTLAGQMVSEGFLSWTMPPVARRLITRALAILPCFMVVLMTGREGLANVLNLSQVVLSLLLPFVTAPLIMFTCSKEIMRVPITAAYEGDIETEEDFSIHTSEHDHMRYKSREPAIKLQDLRKSHPCAGFEEEEPLQISSSTQENESLIQHTNDLRSINHPEYAAGIPTNRKDPYDNKVVGYKDLSNGPLTTVGAILVWGFITALNLFLIGSLVLGYDVPF
ncbi:Manganese transporter smf1 [Yamadazyma tenuis]|nr:Manganese transporter smf1 [Yamadazyma tenuis]